MQCTFEKRGGAGQETKEVKGKGQLGGGQQRGHIGCRQALCSARAASCCWRTSMRRCAARSGDTPLAACRMRKEEGPE